MNQNTVASQADSASKNAVAITATDGEDPAFASLGASLAEIRKLKGVTGYIMRGSASALLDISERGKISQYAILSYQMHESCVEIAKQLSVAEIESVLVEGKNQKVLLMKIGENKISVFMEKGANHVWIIKRILI